MIFCWSTIIGFILIFDMKYFININQLILSKTKLTLTDAAILDWIVAICNSKNKKIEEQRIDDMTWINYTALLIDMPLLKSSSKITVSRAIKAITEAGYIQTKRINNQRLYATLTPKIDTLTFNAHKKN